MLASTIEQLERFGPDRCETLSVQQARAWCRRVAGGRYENFSVLSHLVSRHLRDDFAAVYAFCRWADDLGDEVGHPARSLELLAWWKRELEQCFAGQPRHPVFMALEPTIRQHGLPFELFDDLISAFEQDQTVTRYETWEQLLGYCRRSANPVGRLVLMMCGERREESLYAGSDAVCTALQLANHWQDVRRDLVERDRVYIPREMVKSDRFEERLRASARLGHGVDREFLGESRIIIRDCVERTWPLFMQSGEFLNELTPATRPLVWLFAAGGQHVLRMIERWNYETALHRPKVSHPAKIMLVAKAWWMHQRTTKLGRST